MSEIEWGNPKRRRRPEASTALPVKRTSCVVCGLRADCLICKECALNTEASIKWLEQLPASELVTKAITFLRSL